MSKDWHDHQKETQDKLKSEIANKEATICDLMRLNESYADRLHISNRICNTMEEKEEINKKLISLYKEQNEVYSQKVKRYKILGILNVVAVAILCVISILTAVELMQVKSENQMLKQQQEKPIGERKQA